MENIAARVPESFGGYIVGGARSKNYYNDMMGDFQQEDIFVQRVSYLVMRSIYIEHMTSVSLTDNHAHLEEHIFNIAKTTKCTTK